MENSSTSCRCRRGLASQLIENKVKFGSVDWAKPNVDVRDWPGAVAKLILSQSVPLSQIGHPIICRAVVADYLNLRIQRYD